MPEDRQYQAADVYNATKDIELFQWVSDLELQLGDALDGLNANWDALVEREGERDESRRMLADLVVHHTESHPDCSGH